MALPSAGAAVRATGTRMDMSAEANIVPPGEGKKDNILLSEES
jgi:hypothetical protein